ncbi:MAG: DUF485 domain-containing protein [Verrucomicrobia bacterium]|nr:DUF485 domain-containing protein [Verrucomicrobiota bacterium]
MEKPSSDKKPDMHSEEFLHLLMRRQLKLSIACAFAFLVVLLGLPLANYFAPELMARRIFGFTLTWFLLGIGFFPAVWCISFYFIRRSIRLEEEEVKEVKDSNTQAPKDPITQAGAQVLWVLGYLGPWILSPLCA